MPTSGPPSTDPLSNLENKGDRNSSTSLTSRRRRCRLRAHGGVDQRCHWLKDQIEQDHMGVEPKIGGKTTKMDGL